MREERAQHLRQLRGTRVADQRAVEAREARPVDRRARLAFVLVAADEGHRVAAARIRNRDAGIARYRDAGGDARHDLESHTLFVEEQRLSASAIEHERVAPLQPRDGLALARLLGQQVADRLLFERLRGGHADVDLFRIRPRGAQQAGRHEMVVQHDVGGRQALQTADGHEAGVAGPRADQIDNAQTLNSQISSLKSQVATLTLET